MLVGKINFFSVNNSFFKKFIEHFYTYKQNILILRYTFLA